MRLREEMLMALRGRASNVARKTPRLELPIEWNRSFEIAGLPAQRKFQLDLNSQYLTTPAPGSIQPHSDTHCLLLVFRCGAHLLQYLQPCKTTEMQTVMRSQRQTSRLHKRPTATSCMVVP